MPRTCSICAHDQCQVIDRALLAGEPYRNIAVRFGTSVASLQRHKSDHLPKKLTQAKAAREVAEADDLLHQLKALRNKAISILQKAEQAGDYRTALAGIREARGCVETLMEVEGELDRRGTINVTINPEWVQLRTVIVTALQRHPEALHDVTTAIAHVEGDTHARIA